MPDITTQQQHTVARPATVSGVGLHSGERVTVTFQPAAPDTGIVFVRTDLPGQPAVRAHVSSVVDTSKAPRRTSISSGAAEVHTIEHAMAALWGVGIDNVRVDISGVELPFGSAKLMSCSLAALYARLAKAVTSARTSSERGSAP